MTDKKNSNKSLTASFFAASNLSNIGSGIVILLYSIFITNISIIHNWKFILGIIVFILLAHFVLSPITNIFITHNVNSMIIRWEKVGLNENKRTELFKKLHKLPRKKQLETFLYFAISSFGIMFFYKYLLKMPLTLNICAFYANLLGAFVASLLTLSYSRRICSNYEAKLVEEGLNREIYEAKQIYGISYKKCFSYYCITPVVWSCLLFVFMFAVYFFYNVPTPNGLIRGTAPGLTAIQIPKIIIILVINCFICACSIYSFLKSILTSTQKLQDSMNHILKNDIFTVKPNSSDYENEFTYNIGLLNDVIQLFRSMLENVQKIGQDMAFPISKLSDISQNTAASSLEQSSGIKEILAIMEETDNQTKEILKRISDVTDIAESTSSLVDEGSNDLQLNLYKMDEITEANLTTINGIRDLSEKIGNVWEIVKIINNIADQTRIIAFNAELEASSAGESGKNFHIVANEVRRLASGITNSVNKIKERITEIQHSSDNLIITSESGTEKIREGQKLFEKLDERFSEIRKSSDFTVESAKQIKDYIYQQSAAFDQIVTTVRQISLGIENFSVATNTVNDTANKLKAAADKLENLNKILID